MQASMYIFIGEAHTHSPDFLFMFSEMIGDILSLKIVPNA